MPDYLDDGSTDYTDDGSDAHLYRVPDTTDDGSDGSDAHFNRSNDPAYLDTALESGVSPSLVSQLKNAWSKGGSAVDSVSAWAKSNPGLASMLTSGLGNAQKQKYSNEQLAKSREWHLADIADARAYDKGLWDRRNQSVIGTNTADLGIIGGAMLDPHVAYLQGRKT